jgi:hypothetical protein
MFRLFTAVSSLAPLAAARRGVTANSLARHSFASIGRGGATEFKTLSEPAPGSPFHYAFPVHDLEAAKEFYGKTLGCAEGRSSDKVHLLSEDSVLFEIRPSLLFLLLVARFQLAWSSDRVPLCRP